MTGLVDHTGRPVNGAQPAQAPDPMRIMAQQRMAVLQELGGALLEAERKAMQKPRPGDAAPRWNPFSAATFTVRVRTELVTGTVFQVAPGLFGQVAVTGKDATIVVLSCQKVRRFMEAERATGNPTPDVGVDPMEAWQRGYEQAVEQ